jgi:hypothetical protein
VSEGSRTSERALRMEQVGADMEIADEGGKRPIDLADEFAPQEFVGILQVGAGMKVQTVESASPHRDVRMSQDCGRAYLLTKAQRLHEAKEIADEALAESQLAQVRSGPVTRETSSGTTFLAGRGLLLAARSQPLAARTYLMPWYAFM